MNNNEQRRTNDITMEDRHKKVSSIENQATRNNLEVEEQKIIRHIADVSVVEDWDREAQYAILSEKIRKMESRKKAIYLYGGVGSGVAAVVLVFILSVFWMRNRPAQNNNAASVPSLQDLGDDSGVILTREDGLVVNLTEKQKNSVSIDDPLFNFNKDKATQETATQVKYNTLEVPKTKDFTLLLADGTVVKINSESRIKFPNRFSDTERRVILEEGEAFFDVARSEKVPFIVEVKNSSIRVMGTSFNVNAYPEHNVKTTLVEGKVKIKSETSAKEVTLIPGQQAELKEGEFQVAKVDIDPYIAWTKGLFIFNKLDLKSIMAQLNRWYDMNVTFEDPAVEAYTFTGAINKKYTKEQIFDLIEKTTQIKIEVRNGSNVFIRKN